MSRAWSLSVVNSDGSVRERRICTQNCKRDRKTCRCAFAPYQEGIFINVIRLLLMSAGYRIVKGIN